MPVISKILRELARLYTTMKRIYLIIFLTIYIYNTPSATGLDAPYCFKFTWPGSRVTSINCTVHKNSPCIEPILSDSKPPNTTQIWNDISDKSEIQNSEFFCELKPDNVCIKYTYIYNDAVVNVSYFCGKVIEDQTSAITSGCYNQRTEGYTIEACACQSRINGIPCNSTIKNTYSILITYMVIVTSLFMNMYKTFNISLH